MTAEIVVGDLHGWAVPRDAVRNGNKGPFVFQVDAGHAKRVNVNVTGSVEDTSLIDGDIDPALKLVVWGNYELNDGDAVRAEAAQGENQRRVTP